MHEQNWQERVKFDWAGEHGPPVTEEDLEHCVIRRILRNDFNAPWDPPVYVRWTPELRDNFFLQRLKEYIPGQQKIPPYPRLSTLTKQEHLSGLKVLSAESQVQPWDYPSPTSYDYESFEKVKGIYEKEQYEYQLWAKQCWVNGDCIRTLHPKPLLETVYEAQFELKKNEIHSLPISYRMAAQIHLETPVSKPETPVNVFQFQPIKDLKSVDVSSLPNVKYPNVLKQDLSILQPYQVPKPCRLHSSRFILPDETTVSDLPLPEVQRQLAHFAMENGAAIIASENALECLLDTDRSWKLPVSVVEVLCPEGDGKKTVLVLGNEFSVEKECGAQRTYKSYRHLLRNTFTKQTDLSYSSFAGKLAFDDAKQRRRLTEGAHISKDVTKNSNVSSDAETPSGSSVPNRLTVPNQLGTTTESEPEVSVPDGDGVKTVVVFGNACSIQKQCGTFKSYKHLLGNTLKKSTETSTINLPRQMTTSRRPDLFHSREVNQNCSYSDEEDLKIDVIEQRRRLTEGPDVLYDDTNNSIAPSDAEPSGCDSESNRPIIDVDEQQTSKGTEFEPEVLVPVKPENFQTVNQKQNLPHLIGTDSHEEPSSEESFRTGAEIEVAVPYEEQKQINFATMYDEIDDTQTSEKISFNTTTLYEAINRIIGEDPSSREDIDDINCTCKGTKFEVPSPRSFKKWHINNACSNRGFDLIIHSSHKVRKGESEVILEPIVEWQPELGACKQSAGRLRALALALMIRPMANLINVRVDYKNGNIIEIDKLDETTFISRHGDKRSDIADRIHTTIDQLRCLKPGQYILAHDLDHGSHAMLYSAHGASRGKHTLSLRPEKECLSEVEEATLAKIPPVLSQAVLPYHRAQEILPLAFTTNKKHVKETLRVIRQLALPKVPPNVYLWRDRKGKMGNIYHVN